MKFVLYGMFLLMMAATIEYLGLLKGYDVLYGICTKALFIMSVVPAGIGIINSGKNINE